MPITVPDMSSNITGLVKTPVTKYQDFRLRSSQIRQNNAVASKYEQSAVDDQKAKERQGKVQAVLQQVGQNDALKTDEQKLQSAGDIFMGLGYFPEYQAVQKQMAEQKKEKAAQQKAQLEVQALDQKENDAVLYPIAVEGTLKQVKLSHKMLSIAGREKKAELLGNFLQENEERLKLLPEKQQAQEIRNVALSLMSPDTKKSAMKDLGDSYQETNPLAPNVTLTKGISPDKQYDINNPKAQEQSRYPAWEQVRTDDGIAWHNRFTNEVKPYLNERGEQVQHAIDDPETRGSVSESQAAGRETGQAYAKVRFDLPMVDHTATKLIRHIDEMIGSPDSYNEAGEYKGQGKIKRHKGFEDFVGATLLPGAQYVPGTQAASYKPRHKQVVGGAFAEAFQKLKGGGAISDTEGAAATAALARIDEAANEEEYVAAARDFQREIKKLQKIAHERAELKMKWKKRKSRKVDTSELIEVDW